MFANNIVKPIIASIRVGWSRDFGWTNPILGFSLRTVAPIASTMTALAVFWVAFFSVPGNNQAHLSFTLAWIMIGATLYGHISAYAWVPTLAIAEGKWTNVFPQVYVSPKSSPPYLAGRCLASFASSSVTSIAALIVAYLLATKMFNIPILFVVTPITILMVALAFLVNIFGSMGLGFMLGAYTIFASKFEWALPSYVAGLLMIFSEALFPVTQLPWPFSTIGNFLPFTEFIRAARVALLPDYGSFLTYLYYLGICLVGGVVILVAGLVLFRYAEERARRLGVLDRKVV